jgi:hypothetical protein
VAAYPLVVLAAVARQAPPPHGLDVPRLPFEHRAAVHLSFVCQGIIKQCYSGVTVVYSAAVYLSFVCQGIIKQCYSGVTVVYSAAVHLSFVCQG